MGNVPKKMKFEYVMDPAYREVFVGGATGGITPTGELFLQFFSERSSTPVSFEVEVRPDFDSSKMPVSGEDAHVERTIIAGIFIPRTVAEGLSRFLISQLEASSRLEEVRALEADPK
jgi:hypothetical protein